MLRDQEQANGARADSPTPQRINRLEATVLRRLFPRRRPPRLVIAATTSARGSLLWLLIAAGMALRAGTSRRAALHALTALPVAAAGSHLLGKAMIRRRRPRAEQLPARRALPERLTSSSFPSAHAASAAAFTTAVALESPRLGAAVAPLALLVAYSRVRTRAHWPTDVLAGLVLGVLAAETASGLSRVAQHRLTPIHNSPVRLHVLDASFTAIHARSR